MNIPPQKMNIFDHPKFYTHLTYLVIWGILPNIVVDPPLMQRMLMVNSKEQARNKFLGVSVLHTAIIIIVGIIGLCCIVLYPKIESKNILYFAINDLVSNPWIKACVMSGLIAVVMSTADSYMHSAGITLSHDIIAPIFKNNIKKNEVLYARISTLLIAVCSIIIALKAEYFVTLNMWATKITVPILFGPMILGIIGVKGSKKSLISSMIFGIGIFLILNRYLPTNMKLLAIPSSMVANILAFLLIHIFENNGIVLASRGQEEVKKKNKKWSPSIDSLMKFIINNFPTPSRLYRYSKESVMKYGSHHILFGIFCCVNFTLPYFLWDHPNKEIFDLMTFLRLIGGVMAGLLIVRNQWKEFLKPYFHVFWHITLCFCLPFITTFMVLLSKGSVIWLVHVSISIFFLILLVSGGMFLIILPTGIFFALWFYKVYFGNINLASLGFDVNYNLIYVFTFSTVISLLFAYRKRLFYLIRGNQGINLGGALSHELKNCGFQSLPTAQLVAEYAKMGQEKTVNGQQGYFTEKRIHENVISFAEETAHHMQETINISETFDKIFREFKDSIANPIVTKARNVVEKTIKEFHFASSKQKEMVKLDLINDFYAKIPKEAFSYVLNNIIRNAFKHGNPSEIKIWLENNKIHIWDNGIGISPSQQLKIFEMYHTTGDKKSSGIGLAFSKQLVESCYGEIWVESESEGINTYTEFIIKLPEVSSSEIDKTNLEDIAKEGLSKGVELTQLKTAKEMLRNKEPITKIKKYTGLTDPEIQEIRREL